MFEYPVTISWQRGEKEIFTDSKYSREHKWSFENGNVLPASPSTHIVPLPYSNENYIDPEEAFVAAVSSCHMLSFLDVTAQAGFVVDHYEDEAVGVLRRIARGVMGITKVTLKVKASYSGERIPSRAELEELHHKAHEVCFIANSVKCDIITEIIS